LCISKAVFCSAGGLAVIVAVGQTRRVLVAREQVTAAVFRAAAAVEQIPAGCAVVAARAQQVAPVAARTVPRPVAGAAAEQVVAAVSRPTVSRPAVA
jgi:hypothetical protein